MTEFRSESQQPVSRRDFLKVVASTGLALGLGASSYRRFFMEEGLVSLTDTRFLMGTIVHMTVVAQDPADGRLALSAAFAEMQRLVDVFDYRKAASPLAQLNQAGFLEGAPAELVEVISTALAYCRKTEGAYDITIKPLLDAYRAGRKPGPAEHALTDYSLVEIENGRVGFGKPGMQVTLDSLAKGRIIDGTASILRSLGYDNILVEAGGDLIALGSTGGDEPWQVGILNPRLSQSNNTLTKVPITSRAMATSGDYFNSFSADYSQNHIIDPATGASPPDLASVSVIAPTAMDADALSTAIMVLGPDKGMALANQLADVEALLVDKQLKVSKTPGFPVGME